MAACISGSSSTACWTWPNFVQSSLVERMPMVLVAAPPDHGYEDGDVLGAMLTGEVTRLLELLLHIISLDARVWVDRY
jgi:hypothetical protein